LTLTLDRVILHTVMHHSSTFNYIPLKSRLFVEGRTDGRTDGHLRPTLLGPLGGVDLKSSSMGMLGLLHLSAS